MDNSPKIVHDVMSYGSLFRIIVVAAAIFFVFLIKDVIAIVFVSLVFAAAISPMIDWLNAKKVPRSASILVIYLVLFLFLTTAFVLIIPPVAGQVKQISKSFPEYYSRVVEELSPVDRQNALQGKQGDAQRALDTFQENVSRFATEGLPGVISSVFDGLAFFLVMLVLTFYMTLEKDGIKKFFMFLAPSVYHSYVANAVDRIQKKTGMWLRGQLILMVAVGLLTFIGLVILQVPYSAVLALIAGLTEIIPYAGPIIGAVPAVFLAFTDSPVKGLLVILLYFIVQQLENNILVPKVMQKAVGIHPIAVIVVILVGVKLGGIVGAIFAVPVATAGLVLLEDYYREYFKNQQAVGK